MKQNKPKNSSSFGPQKVLMTRRRKKALWTLFVTLAFIPFLLWLFAWTGEEEDHQQQQQQPQQPQEVHRHEEESEVNVFMPKMMERFHSMDEKTRNQIKLNIDKEFKFEKISPKNSEKTRKKILLLSSNRTGSSFLTELIGSYPGVFIHFNPEAGSNPDRAYRLIDEAVSCNLNRDYYESLRAKFAKIAAKNPRFQSLCLGGKKKFDGNYLDERCLEGNFANEVCSLFPITLVKSADFPASNPRITHLLDLDPDLSVILLHRDPRGAVSSLLRLADYPDNSKKALIKEFCSRESKDVEQISNLAQKFPGRIHLLRFEDLSLETENEVKNLFDFLDLKVTVSVKSFVQSHTLPYHNPALEPPPLDADEEDLAEDPFSTFRRTYQSTFRWIRRLDKDTIDLIEDECGEAMKVMGYKKVSEVPRTAGVPEHEDLAALLKYGANELRARILS